METIFSLIRTASATHPAFLSLAIIFLPLFGVPVSPFFVLAGIAYGLKLGLLASAIGLTLNIILAYWIAARFLRTTIQKIVHRSGRALPEFPPCEYVRGTLLLRLTPGFPLSLQNYILGLARVPFKTYLLISLPAQYFFMIGYLVSGGALFEGKLGLIIVGVSLIIASLLLTKIVRNLYGKK